MNRLGAARRRVNGAAAVLAAFVVMLCVVLQAIGEAAGARYGVEHPGVQEPGQLSVDGAAVAARERGW